MILSVATTTIIIYFILICPFASEGGKVLGKC